MRFMNTIARVALVSALGAGAACASAFTFDGSDWLSNGNGEATATGNMNNTIDPNFQWSLPGWPSNNCTNGTVEVRSYASIWDMADVNGTDGWGYAGPSAAERGDNLIIGGGPRTGGDGGQWWYIGMYKDNWIYGNTAAIAQIDTGTVAYDFSGWLGGVSAGVWTGTGGWAQAKVHFFGNDAGAPHVDQWVTLGSISEPYRTANGTGDVWSRLTYDQETGFIPVGTRRAEIFVYLGHDVNGWSNDATYTWGAVDNISFKVTQTVPEPATMAALGLGVIGLLARRRKKS
jgi:hypothetical protein